MRHAAVRLGTRIERLMRPTLARWGYEPQAALMARLGPIDLRGVMDDPVAALVRTAGLRFVIDIPLERCRGHRAAAFSCQPGAGHPYVETAVGLAQGRVTGYADSPVAQYYRHFQPPSAAAYLGIEPTHDLLRAPAAAMFLPWEEAPAPGVQARRAAALARENASHGRVLGAEHGYHHFGPVSEAKGALEIARLERVLETIRREGFRLLPGPDGLSRARILTSGADFVAMVTSGHHRTAAVAALGHTAAALWPLPGIVRREQAAGWPAVRAGIMSLDQALAVFDRVFAGRQPAALAPGYWQAIGARARPAASTAAE